MVTLWVSVSTSTQQQESHFPDTWLCPESLWQVAGATTQLATLEVERPSTPHQAGFSPIAEMNVVGSL